MIQIKNDQYQQHISKPTSRMISVPQKTEEKAIAVIAEAINILYTSVRDRKLKEALNQTTK